MNTWTNSIFWWTGAAVWFTGGLVLALSVMSNLLYQITKASYDFNAVVKTMHALSKESKNK